MVYDDNIFPTPEEFENMAKEYSNAVRQKGFIFVNMFFEDYSLLLDEIFDILFKLSASYRFLNGFLGSDDFLNLTEEHIDKLRQMFDYKKNRAVQVKTNNTKCLLNTISLENLLTLKLFELAKKSEKVIEIFKIISDRLKFSNENYKIEGIFNNLINLSF